MTERICGKDDSDLAILYLKEKFIFVALIEKLDESPLFLKNELNLKNFNMYYEKKNVNVKKEKNERSDKMIERVKEANQNDLNIYEFVKEELFPWYKTRYGASLAKDLENLNQEQQQFRFNHPKILLHGLLRHGLYKPVKKFLHNKYLKYSGRNSNFH